MPTAPDRQTQIDILVDHFKRPRHKGTLEAADSIMPGGNPGCGDLVTMHLKADDAGRVAAVRFEGEGCTISQAAASILADRMNKTHPTLDEVVDFPYEQMVDLLGKEIVGFRERCATLALGTLKMAAKQIQIHRRLRAAGRSDDEIRALERALVDSRSDSGLVFGQAAEEQRGVGGAER